MIGEIGTEVDFFSPAQERVFRAAARAQQQTGVAISTHCQRTGRLGPEQVAILLEEGVAPDRIVIGHHGDKRHVEHELGLLEQGVYVQIDHVGFRELQPDEQRARNVKAIIDAGFGDRRAHLAGRVLPAAPRVVRWVRLWPPAAPLRADAARGRRDARTRSTRSWSLIRPGSWRSGPSAWVARAAGAPLSFTMRNGRSHIDQETRHMRLALFQMGQETDTFNPSPTTLEDFERFGIYEGQEILDNLRGNGTVGGFINAIEASGADIEIVPLSRGWAGAGGRITTEALALLRGSPAADLQSAGSIDGLAMHLHGACSAEGVDDVEGRLLAICREVLGHDVPIVLTIDHHANVTQAMVDLCDAIVGYRTQPHDPLRDR